MTDEDSAERLVTLAQGDSEPFVRQAACLALGAIGSDTALEGLGQALLGGDEELRLAAAEALAIHPDEGYGMLREAALALDFTTFYGRFRVESPTGRQTGHTMPVVQWRSGKKTVVWPQSELPASLHASGPTPL